ncbi:MAG: hypothetical protein N4A53_08030 [Pelagimonas sp.]|jgi:hypothetical protein|nr:hypothetical protein [Pelagimonas sp.]
MTDEINSLLNLPTSTLAIFASGYLAYRLAYTGRDAEHGPIDVIFSVCVFALIGRVSWLAVSSASLPVGASAAEIIGVLAALLGAVSVASFWRAIGAQMVFRMLRRVKISNAHRQTTAWSTVVMSQNLQPEILTIIKTDGSQLKSEGMDQFADLPFGCCIFGEDGSVALYLTHTRSSASEDWEQIYSGPSGDWGAEVTIVPREQISEVSIRS